MDWLLAESELSDWLQALLVILLVAGSAFAAVAKKLIEFFGGAKADDSPSVGDKPTARSAGPEPQRPVARPMTPQRRTASPRTPPVAAPFPSQATSETPRPVQPPRPPAAPGPRPAPLVPPSLVRERPPARPTIHEGLPSEKPSVVGHGGEVPPHLPSEDLRDAHITERGHEDLPSEVRAGKREARGKGPAPSRRLSRAPLIAEVVAEPAADQGLRDLVRHPTRAELRRAIIMNEILGPPVAVRPLEEWS
jgi:hypothetical protein